jgi:glycosyltransferase involved in cell wall biosynthesis
LRSAGADWWKIADFSLDGVPNDTRAACDRRVSEIVQELDAHRPWVLKEPRLCLLFPVWRVVVDGAVCVIVHRSPVQVAYSLQKRNRFPLAFGVSLWERYTLEALSVSLGLPRFLVSYERLMSDPVFEVDRLCRRLKAMGVDGLGLPRQENVASLIRSDLFHHRQQNDEFSQLLNQRQSDLARAMADGTAIDMADAPPLSRPAHEILHLYQAHRVTGDELEALRAQERLRTREVETLRARVLSLGEQLEGERRDSRSSRKQLGDVIRDLDAVRNEVKGLEDENRRLREAVDGAIAERRRVQAANDRVLHELESLKSDVARIEGERRTATARTSQLESEVARLQEVERNSKRDRILLSETVSNNRRLERAVEDLLVFLRRAQQRYQEIARLRRLRFGPLEILPRRRTASAMDGLSEVFRELGGWVRRQRSLLVRLVRPRGPTSAADALRTNGSVGPERTGEPIRPAVAPSAGAGGGSPRRGLTVAVVAWDVGHNPLGRAYMLAEALQRHYRVVLLGPSFSRYGRDVWQPVREGRVTTIPIPGTDFPQFATLVDRIAPRIAADVIVACKPRLPSVQLGLLMKSFLNRPLIIDVDDHELSFFDHRTPLTLEDVRSVGVSNDLSTPFGETWTRFCESLIPLADAVTVSNEVLQGMYGGTLVPHARDELRFDPSLHDRAAHRHKLGIGDHERLVLFAGTPRRHKGVLEVLRAVKATSEPRYRLVVVGTPPDPNLGEALRREGGDVLTLLPDQPFDTLPGLVLAADLVCVFQDPESDVSKTQLPVKVIDALAMGVPVIASSVPPLDPLIDAGAVEVVDIDRLAVAIERALSDSVSRRRAQLARRDLFMERYSYSAIGDTLVSLIDGVLADPKPVGPKDLEFTGLQRSANVPAVATRRVHDDAIDIVMFWKQNDTGLYGRRHEMLVKYLARRPEVRKIVVFDHPISLELLQKRASSAHVSQWREVYRETMIRTWGVRDTEDVTFDCFVYSTGTRGRDRQIWPWPKRSDYYGFLDGRLDDLGIDPSRAVFWFYPKNLDIPEIARRYAPRVRVVDIIDDHRTWPGLNDAEREQLTRHYAEVLELADLAIANCEPVRRSLSVMRGDIQLVPNGCEVEGAPDVLADPRLVALRDLSGPKLGFVGNLEAKIDRELLRYLAEQRPNWQIVLVGSTHANPEILELDVYPNVHFVGVVRYPEVRAWINEFDVALVPHRDTEQTRSMNPLKVLVYCSLGVPVVSANVQNLGDFENFVYMADSHQAFLEQVENAIRAGGARDQDLLEDCLEHNSWEARVNDIIARLLELSGSPSDPLNVDRGGRGS